MMRLVPHPFMIGALGELADRCVSTPGKNMDMIESVCNGMRGGGGP